MKVDHAIGCVILFLHSFGFPYPYLTFGLNYYQFSIQHPLLAAEMLETGARLTYQALISEPIES